MGLPWKEPDSVQPGSVSPPGTSQGHAPVSQLPVCAFRGAPRIALGPGRLWKDTALGSGRGRDTGTGHGDGTRPEPPGPAAPSPTRPHREQRPGLWRAPGSARAAGRPRGRTRGPCVAAGTLPGPCRGRPPPARASTRGAGRGREHSQDAAATMELLPSRCHHRYSQCSAAGPGPPGHTSPMCTRTWGSSLCLQLRSGAQ